MAMLWGRSEDHKQIRCPYCVAEGQFRIMEARSSDDWFVCAACGHVTLPSNPAFECACEKCANLRRIQ
jgi:uncharacterized Zn finger protein